MVLIEGLVVVVVVGLVLFLVSVLAFGGALGCAYAASAAGSHWWWDFDYKRVRCWHAV